MKLKKTLIITALTLFFVASTLASTAEKVETKCPKTSKVEVLKIAGQQFKEYKAFKGKVSPAIIAVKSLVSGKVTDIKITEGDLIFGECETLNAPNPL